MPEQTQLYPEYRSYPGIRLIDFSGWEMPVNFEAGIIREHQAVRQKAGIFDVSHMGEFIVEGSLSETFLNQLITNDLREQAVGQAVYSPMCYPDGTVVDDLIIYKLNIRQYMLVVNAGNLKKDWNWIAEEAPLSRSGVEISDVSDSTAQIALQGPLAENFLASYTDADLSAIGYYRFLNDCAVLGHKVIVSRTGYTGEHGFELYGDPDALRQIWRAFVNDGAALGIIPCGLGARDTLRTEVKFPLYGHEISDEISPLEAGLKKFIAFEKPDFIGKSALVSLTENGIPRVLRGCIMIDKGVPRSGCEVYRQGEKIGVVTSGTKSPSLNEFIAILLVPRGLLKTGEEIQIKINGREKRGKIVKMPFYQGGAAKPSPQSN